MCQTEIKLRIARGQLDSAPLMHQFGMTPRWGTERPDCIRTVMSLAVRIWMGRPLQFSNNIETTTIVV